MGRLIKAGKNTTGPSWRRVFHDEVKAGFRRSPDLELILYAAGSIGAEVRCMSEFCLAQLENHLAGRPLESVVDFAGLDSRA